MGIRHLAAALYDHHGLPPTGKLVLVAIADHINDESGWGWPSTARLAGLCGISRRNVLKWIDHLEKAGHIEVRRRPGWANHYRLGGVASDTGVGSDTGVASDTGVVSHPTLSGVASDTQTRRTRREPRARAPKGRSATVDTPTPTPPHVDAVLAHLEQYR